MELSRYSMGIGDRFGRQGKALLNAFLRAGNNGEVIVPVWNKSHREHRIIGSHPSDVKDEADAAVAALGWGHPYFVDADHVGMDNVLLFTGSSSFFTLDVADFIDRRVSSDDVDGFVCRHRHYIGSLEVPGTERKHEVTEEVLRRIAIGNLAAVREAARIYRAIVREKGEGTFVTEISMDESVSALTPLELFFILAELACMNIEVATIAPKFPGRFNKGIDYVGDIDIFAQVFEQHVCVATHAAREFGLPAALKLSIHSGSDKFSLYPVISDILARHGAGVHLKTAGTTWLEELTGLALAGGEALGLVVEIYREAYTRIDELCAPYSEVIDINSSDLPSPATLQKWSGEQFAATLRHDPACPSFNSNLRQLLHVGYKVAAEMGHRYLNALDIHHDIIAEQVTANIYERHLRPLFFSNRR